MALAKAAKAAPPRMKRIRVLRAFYWQGKPTVVSDELEVPALFAAELVAAHKAEFIQPAAPPEPSHQQQADAERGGPETRFGPGGAPPPETPKPKEKSGKERAATS